MKETLKKVLTGLMASAVILTGFAACSMNSGDEGSKSTASAVEPVVFSASGEVASGTTVTLKSSTSGAVIYWSKTTALTSANAASAGTKVNRSYTAIDVTEACTIYAIAYKSGSWSDPSSAAFTIKEGSSSGGDEDGDETVSYGRIVKDESLADGTYLIGAFVSDKYKFFQTVGTNTYGYIKNVTELSAEDNVVKTSDENILYAIAKTDSGYTIKDISTGKYLLMSGSYNSFNYNTAPSEGQYWDITAQTDGTFEIKNKLKSKVIQWDSSYSSYGAYEEVTGTLPCLFLKGAAGEGVTGPESVSDVSFSVESGSTVRYASKVTLSSATDGATIYYSTESFDSSSLPSKTGTSVSLTADTTIYAMAALNGVYSNLTSATYTVTPVEYTTDNYTFDGGIADVISTIGENTSDVELSSSVSGVVTIALASSFVIQDKNAAIMVYKSGYVLPEGCGVGSYVTVNCTKGKVYNKIPEVTSYDSITSTKANDVNALYYEAMPYGTTDFSSYLGLTLKAVRADASFTSDNSVFGSKPTEDGVYLGYVQYISNTSKYSFYRVYSLPAETIEKPDTYVAPVTFSTTGEVKAGTAVELSSATDGASIYYSTSAELTADNYATAGSLYSEAITVNEAVTIYAIAVNGAYVSEATNASYTIAASNTEKIVFADLGYENAAEISSVAGTDCTLTFDKGTGSVIPKYYTSGTGARLYTKNTLTVSSDSKKIAGIAFNWQSGYAPAEGKWTPDAGTYDVTTATWTPSEAASSVTFTSGATVRLVSVTVTYAE